jgi:hypothetical protein
MRSSLFGHSPQGGANVLHSCCGFSTGGGRRTVEQREAAQVERDQADRRRQTTEKVPDTAAAAIWQWSMLGRADRLMERKEGRTIYRAAERQGPSRVRSVCEVPEVRVAWSFFFFKNRAQHGSRTGFRRRESPSDVASQKPAQNTKPSLIRIHPDVREGRAL